MNKDDLKKLVAHYELTKKLFASIKVVEDGKEVSLADTRRGQCLLGHPSRDCNYMGSIIQTFAPKEEKPKAEKPKAEKPKADVKTLTK